MGHPAEQDEKALIFWHKENSSQTRDRVLASAPMIGDALIHALETSEPGSVHVTRCTATMFVLDVAFSVLRVDTYDVRTHEAARTEMAKLEYLPLLSRLEGIINVADGSEYIRTDWRTVLVERIVGLGEFVRSVGHLRIATDIFAKAAQVRHVTPAVNMLALQGRGWTLRQLGDHFRSERVYRELHAVAEESSDMLMALDADLGLSTIMVERGALGDAEALTRAVLDRATRIGASKLTSRAHGNLACIAGIQERFDAAIVHADAAIRGPQSPIDYDICVANIAFAFRQLRRWRCAEWYAKRVVRDAEGIEQRTSGLITLCHLALDRRGDASPLRADIDTHRISSALRVDVYELDARVAWWADDKLTARRELEQGIAFAEGHKANRAAFLFDEALQTIEAGKVPQLFYAPRHLPSVEHASAVRSIEARSHGVEPILRHGIRLATPADDDKAVLASAAGIVLTGS